ncbi:hypothetical protein CGZ80_05235 [Rhodopirellula sp. MGV]|nr:hypothetical protein CGZ80_05235 [Rhodopirellula sp. MGV]PNY37932.1 hypothetical protein C2E31_05375 [Rhodopirellula baltica]
MRRLIKAPAAWALVWPMALLVTSYFAYSHWFSAYFAAQHQGIDPANIEITAPHEYVRTDVVEDVNRWAHFGELSSLDREATPKIASAFKNHPWIRDVRSVVKLPGGKFRVEVDYRRPVASFHVTGDPQYMREIESHLSSLGMPTHGKADEMYFPLDGEGHMLPTENISTEEVRRLIQIEVKNIYPTGVEGTLFGDKRVESAATLANLLSAVSDRIQIAKIMVSGDPRMNIVPQLSLVTGTNTKLLWGSPPGMEQPNERGAKAKLTDLLSGNFVPDGDLRIATGGPGQIH